MCLGSLGGVCGGYCHPFALWCFSSCRTREGLVPFEALVQAGRICAWPKEMLESNQLGACRLVCPPPCSWMVASRRAEPPATGWYKSSPQKVFHRHHSVSRRCNRALSEEGHGQNRSSPRGSIGLKNKFLQQRERGRGTKNT